MGRTRISLPSVLLLLTALPLWPQSPDADTICAHAVELHRSGDVEHAVPEYQKCLALRPGAPELRSNLGAALAGLGRYAEAIEQYRQALRLAPANPGLRLNLALAYYKSGEIAKAAAELESLRGEQPNNSNVTLLLADCYLRSGEFKRIIDLLGPLEAQYRDDQAFAYLLGMALIHDGQVAKGQLIVDRILRDRDSGEAHYLIATAAFMNRDFPAAVAEFQKAIQINPAMTSVESWYGQALLETGDADGAAAAFRKELASNPNDFESNEKLGAILSARHKFDEALPYLQRAVLVRPGSIEARSALARLSAGAGSPPSPVQADSGLLSVGSPAPGFELPRFGTSGRASLAEMLRDKPAIVMFGSYTCPQFRSAAAALNALYERYRDRAQFVLVYVHEAHTGENWQSTVNQRQGVDLPPEKTLDEKGQHAALCIRKLDLKFPLVVDGMDRKVESAYAAWPSAVYLVGRDGRVLWRSRLGEQNFAPEEMAAAIAQALAAVAQRTR
jgi:Flp pilus assembly protein TadD/thiol-disulfide isomerase/thioredoxin